MDCFFGGDTEEIVLFGHSFGAMVFEVARRLEERGRAAKAVFVSASGGYCFVLKCFEHYHYHYYN